MIRTLLPLASLLATLATGPVLAQTAPASPVPTASVAERTMAQNRSVQLRPHAPARAEAAPQPLPAAPAPAVPTPARRTLAQR